MTKHDFILKIFTGNDILRPSMSRPGQIEEMVYATDAHAAIRFPKSFCEKDYSDNEKFPNAKSIYENLELTEEKELDTDQVLTALYDCDFRYNLDKEDCDKCAGSGEIECDCCGNEADCKECDGHGEIEKETPYAGMEIIGEDVMLNGKRFNPKLLYKALHVAYVLNKEKITMKYSSNSTVLFVMDEVEVLVMAKYVGN